MTAETRRDVSRQIANIIGSIVQIAFGALGVAFGFDVGAISDANRTLIVPANYAFVIWTPIFLLAIAYAVYQAQPSRRDDPLLRRIGWFTAAAFISNGIWEILFPNRLFVLAEIVIIAIWAFLAIAFLRIVGKHRSAPLSRAGRWLVALPIGLMFGWVTAANAVSLAATLVTQGFAGDGRGAAVGGAALLVFGGAVAGAVVLIGKFGPPQGWVAYLGAVLWALVAVAVNQVDDSLLTTGVAVLIAALLVAVAVLLPAIPLRRPASASRIRSAATTS